MCIDILLTVKYTLFSRSLCNLDTLGGQVFETTLHWRDSPRGNKLGVPNVASKLVLEQWNFLDLDKETDLKELNIDRFESSKIWMVLSVYQNSLIFIICRKKQYYEDNKMRKRRTRTKEWSLNLHFVACSTVSSDRLQLIAPYALRPVTSCVTCARIYLISKETPLFRKMGFIDDRITKKMITWACKIIWTIDFLLVFNNLQSKIFTARQLT